VNALSALGVYKRARTTKTEKFTLSKGSGNLLRSMKQNLQVDATSPRACPSSTPSSAICAISCRSTRTRAAASSTTRSSSRKDEEKKKAKDAGLIEQPFGEASDTDEKGPSPRATWASSSSTARRTSSSSCRPDRTDGLEFWITNKIREIRDKGDNIKHKIGVLTGHDEIKLTDANLVPGGSMGKFSMQTIITQNFPFYDVQDVDLKGGDAEIDDDLDGLIITQPGKDLTEKELRRIDQFVMKGKSLAIFASAVNVRRRTTRR
jgi:hypothetical protein